MRLIDLVEELLSFSKGKANLKISPISPGTFIRNTLDLFTIFFKKEHIITEIELQNDKTI